jgi:hypothetical protein
MLLPQDNSSFLGYHQIAWDNTSIAALKHCPRYYYYFIVLGYRPREESKDLVFGLVYHGALEQYHHAKAQGLSHDESILRALRYTLEKTWNRTLGRPWDTQDSYKNRHTLVRTVIWYLDKFEDDPLKTLILANGKPAVELSFRYETTHLRPDGLPYLYSGHLDRLVEFSDKIFISDAKTTKSTIGDWFISSFTPHAQFSGYVYSGQVSFHLPIKGLIVDIAQVAVGFSAFQRSPVGRTQGQLEEWYSGLGDWIRAAESFARKESWPMNEESCGKYGGCKFREICSKSPEMRMQFLDKGFKKEMWNPLITRGDI